MPPTDAAPHPWRLLRTSKHFVSLKARDRRVPLLACQAAEPSTRFALLGKPAVPPQHGNPAQRVGIPAYQGREQSPRQALLGLSECK